MQKKKSKVRPQKKSTRKKSALTARQKMVPRVKSVHRERKRHRLNHFRRFMRHEIANLVTHGIGAGLSIAGLVFLIIHSAPDGNPIRVTAFAIYGACITTLYLSSTLYHSLMNPRLKRIFRKLHHSAIFLTIAGTYTPVALLVLKGALGWWVFGIIWFLALAGILYKILALNFGSVASALPYIIMGWLLIAVIKPLYDVLPAAPLWWIFGGGLFYTVGTIFYAAERLPYHHMIWHLFVLAGSVCHYIMLYRYV